MDNLERPIEKQALNRIVVEQLQVRGLPLPGNGKALVEYVRQQLPTSAIPVYTRFMNTSDLRLLQTMHMVDGTSQSLHQIIGTIHQQLQKHYQELGINS